MSKGFIGSPAHQAAREKDYLAFIDEGWTIVHERSLRFGGIGGFLACTVWLVFGTLLTVLVTIFIQGPHGNVVIPGLELGLGLATWLSVGLFYLRWRGWVYITIGLATGIGVTYGCYHLVASLLPGWS